MRNSQCGVMKVILCLTNPIAFYSDQPRWLDIFFFVLTSVRLLKLLCDFLIDNLMKCSLDKGMVRWTENGWNTRLGVVISSLKLSWRPITIGVPKGWYWGQHCSTSSSMTHVIGQTAVLASLMWCKLGRNGGWTRWICCYSEQKKIDRLKKWNNRNCMKFHKEKSKAWLLGRRCWGCRRDAGGPVGHKLVISQ